MEELDPVATHATRSAGAAHLRIATIALIIMCQSSQTLANAGIALFLPLIRTDVHLTFSQAGTLAVATTATYAVMQIPSGYLADRVGPTRLFLFGVLGTNVLAFMFAVLHTYESLLINQAMSGIFRSLMFAPGLLLMTSQFRPERRATAMGLYVAAGFSSNIFLNSLGPILIGPLGWRTLFMIFALFGILVAVLYRLAASKGPRIASKEPPNLRALLSLLGHKVLWLCGLVQFIRLSIARGITFWMPTYLVLDKGLSLQSAGLLVALGAAVTAPANFMGGYLSDRLGRPLLVIGTALIGLTISCTSLVYVQSLPFIMAAIVLNAVCVQIYFGPLFEVPIKKIGESAAGTTTGFSNMCANLGGLTFAYALGAIKDATDSFAIGLYSLSALCVVGLMATIVISRYPDVETSSTHALA